MERIENFNLNRIKEMSPIFDTILSIRPVNNV